MSGIIHFGSGKQLTITEAEFQVIGPKLRDKGIKTQVTRSGHLLPLNSSTMEFIEHIPEPKEELTPSTPAIDAQVLTVVDTLPEHNMQEAPPTPKTAEELLEEMTAKSNCKHEPEKLELYIQHTAKGIRYFPVCTFCGKRERYVSESKINKGEYVGTPNEKWTDADVAKAKPWIED